MRSEAKIQYDIRVFLLARGWMSFNMTGNEYQKGVPDLYCCHPEHGKRWVEVKRPKKYSFTKWQLIMFPVLEDHGDDVFVLVDDTMEEYEKLWGPANWRSYLRPAHIARMKKLGTAAWLNWVHF